MQEKIRNFSIIAHIDHGKSTLADRLIEFCGGISEREKENQIMDTMDIEKERGITIKAQSVRLEYKGYILNLIDTPGHVDFSYEVSKSLKSSEGALLVVDSTQGVEAQTLANVYLAVENNLEIIPVINKIDLPSAEPERVAEEIEQTIGIDAGEALLTSAKTGKGIKELLDAIIEKIPAPKGDKNAPAKALIYDSWFDNYLGAVCLIRMFNGSIKKGDEVLVMGTGKKHKVMELFYPHPVKKIKTEEIKTGEIGIVVMGLKNIADIRIGDTITNAKNPSLEPASKFEEAKSFVFAGIYPIDTDKYDELKDALEKLTLNDSSITYEPETSQALGFGFRVGFLGMLHMEVVKERLEREFGIDLIATAPSVTYKIKLTNGTELKISNPSDLPELSKIDKIYEPFVKATILTPNEFIGNLIGFLNDKRGVQKKMEYLSPKRVLMEYELPLNEIITDFYDKLKSITRGYASFDYEPTGYKEGNLVKMDIKVAGEIVDALSIIVSKEKADRKGRELIKVMKELIPRQLFEVAIQASIGNKIIARESVKALRKDVTAKCYGGDISRKRKLLEKQKKGKKRMKSIGKVNIPQEAFLSVLKIN